MSSLIETYDSFVTIYNDIVFFMMNSQDTM